MDLLEILKDKKSVITSFIRILSDEKTVPGLRKMKESKETDIETQVKILTEVVANQQAEMKKMAAALLVYTQSSSFDTDIAQSLNKMGKGQEALRTMFENKLKGN